MVDVMADYYSYEVQYLEKYGYLPHKNSMALQSDAVITQAIQELQRIAGIPITGKMDGATRALLARKRCGLSDAELLHEHKHRYNMRKRKRYAYNGGKWDHHNITYRVVNVARSVQELGYVRREIYDAFNAWNGVSTIRLTETSDPSADIQISFERGHHGDAYPFDRPEVLAHAFPPFDHEMAGDIHLDDDERWAINPIDKHYREISIRSVAMHEVGHSLGLGHSNELQSIMYPYYQATSSLHDDDILAIQALYGSGDFKFTPKSIPPSPLVPSTPSLTTTPPPIKEVTPHVDDIPPDPCFSTIDAVTLIRQEIFMFHRSWFWRIHLDGTLSNGPRKINTFWTDLPTPIDGVFELNDHIYFFRGHKIYEYSGLNRVSTRNLTDLGISDDFDHIRLAYTWYYGNEQRYYIWAEEDYWKLDLNSMKIEVDYPRKIDLNWWKVPKNASAAFSWDKELFFFAAHDVYKFGSLKMSVIQDYPKSFAQVFPYCSAHAEALRTNKANKTFMKKSLPLLILILFLFNKLI
uniref:Matrix metalloproteinase n=3 Tax=Acrobeloides nanus TaxID=290746 RepID=A0A914C1S9_9BILA